MWDRIFQQKPVRYRQVGLEGDSESESEKSLLEKRLGTPKQRDRGKIVLVVSLVVVSCLAVIEAVVLGLNARELRLPSIHQEFIPPLQKQAIAFGDDGEKPFNQVWHELYHYASIDGFVHIPNPEKYGLEPNAPGQVIPRFSNMYMVSAFHSLHCLHELQTGYHELLEGTGPGMDAWHADHCISYIRQSVMCASDTTIEGPDEHPIPGMSPLRGWDYKHKQCRNFDELREFMLENRAELLRSLE